MREKTSAIASGTDSALANRIVWTAVRSFERKLGSWDIMTPTLSWHLSQTTRHCGVGDHAAGTHDLGQIASGYHGRWLIVDAALEASGAPGLNVTQAAREKFAAWNSWECTVAVWWTLCSLTLGWNKPKHQREQDSESCLSSQKNPHPIHSESETDPNNRISPMSCIAPPHARIFNILNLAESRTPPLRDEDSGKMPIHKLNGSLGLDGGHRSVHILWHNISWKFQSECISWGWSSSCAGRVKPTRNLSKRKTWSEGQLQIAKITKI